MSGNLQTKAAIGLGVIAAAVTSLYYYYYYRLKLKQKIPENWRPVGYLKKIYFYPIKSCAGIEIESTASCGVLGINYQNCKDRMLMIVDNRNCLVSARTYPKMLKIHPKLIGKKLNVAGPDISDLEIDYDVIDQGEIIKVDLWGQKVCVTHCGEIYDIWFSKCITGKYEGLKLVYYTSAIATKRVIEETFKNGILLDKDTGSLQDVSSYMLINEQSVEELNSRLKNSIDPKQFRPNFVIHTSGSAFAEDNWKWIKIGNDTIFRNVAPCFRCILPNIDPDTAERNSDGEPLKTLKTYRSWGISKSPRMGLQLAVRVQGEIKLGDEIFVEA